MLRLGAPGSVSFLHRAEPASAKPGSPVPAVHFVSVPAAGQGKSPFALRQTGSKRIPREELWFPESGAGVATALHHKLHGMQEPALRPRRRTAEVYRRCAKRRETR